MHKYIQTNIMSKGCQRLIAPVSERGASQFLRVVNEVVKITSRPNQHVNNAFYVAVFADQF